MFHLRRNFLLFICYVSITVFPQTYIRLPCEFFGIWGKGKNLYIDLKSNQKQSVLKSPGNTDLHAKALVWPEDQDDKYENEILS